MEFTNLRLCVRFANRNSIISGLYCSGPSQPRIVGLKITEFTVQAHLPNLSAWIGRKENRHLRRFTTAQCDKSARSDTPHVEVQITHRSAAPLSSKRQKRDAVGRRILYIYHQTYGSLVGMLTAFERPYTSNRGK